LTRHFSSLVERLFDPGAALTGHVVADGELGAEEFKPVVAETTAGRPALGPAFPAPCFDGKFRLLSRVWWGGNI
jgi:single-stranded-DNA-specific exonuclease